MGGRLKSWWVVRRGGEQGKLWGLPGGEKEQIVWGSEGVLHLENVAAWHLAPHNWVIVFLGRGCQPEREKDRKRTTGGGRIKVGWLLGEKEARKEEKLRDSDGFQEK